MGIVLIMVAISKLADKSQGRCHLPDPLNHGFSVGYFLVNVDFARLIGRMSVGEDIESWIAQTIKALPAV